MVDQRKADRQWPVTADDGVKLLDQVQYAATTLAVLMDIRDRLDVQAAELKKLNELLHAPGLNSKMYGGAWLSTYLRESVKAQQAEADTPAD